MAKKLKLTMQFDLSADGAMEDFAKMLIVLRDNGFEEIATKIYAGIMTKCEKRGITAE